MGAQPISILVIDTDDASRAYLAANLERNGYRVLSASSGREGLVSAWQMLPQVIVVDPALPDLPAVEFITRLRQDRRTAHLPCIALSEDGTKEDVESCLGAGYSDFLLKSGEALPALLKLIPRLFEQDQTAAKTGDLIVFLSAKGGTGTSSLCANLAMCMGKTTSSLKIAVIDMVLPIGSIASIVGYDQMMNLVHAAALARQDLTPAFFGENLPRLPGWYFHLLAGSPDPASANSIQVDNVTQIISAVRQAYDYVFVDLGRSLSRLSLPIIHTADLLVPVLSTDASCVSLTRTVLDYLAAQNVEQKRIYPLLNRVVGLEGLSKADMETALGMEMRAVLPYMGGNFGVANMRHEPVATRFPGDSMTLSLMQTAAMIAGLSGRRDMPGGLPGLKEV